MNDLLKQLTLTADNWAKLGAPALCERFIARNGQCFKGRKLPRSIKRGTPKQCFENSTHLVIDRDGLRYVEGYAMREDICFPFLHAWCIDRDGRVVDVTLTEPEKYQYVGIVLTRTKLLAEMMKNTYYGVLDSGLGLNAKFMFARDPELEGIVRAVTEDKINWNRLLKENAA